MFGHSARALFWIHWPILRRGPRPPVLLENRLTEEFC